jgi:hypothetical protein
LNAYQCSRGREPKPRKLLQVKEVGRCYQVWFDEELGLVCGVTPPPDVSFAGRCTFLHVDGGDRLAGRCDGRFSWAQYPCPGGYALDDSRITCLAVRSIPVPNVVGLESSKATKDITNVDLTPAYDSSCSFTGQPRVFTVVATNPSAGALLRRKEKVTFTCTSASLEVASCPSGQVLGAYNLPRQCNYQCEMVEVLACSLSDAKRHIAGDPPTQECKVYDEGVCQTFDIAVTCSGVCTPNRMTAVDGATAAALGALRGGRQCTAKVGAC